MNNRLVAKPLRGGVIVDLKNAIKLLKPLIRKRKKHFIPPVSLASAPMDTTDKERDLLRKAIIDAGASQVAIVPEIWVAAIGAGIDLTRQSAQLLIDIGDGVTDMAVFRDGRIIYSSSIRLACYDFKKAVRSLMATKYRITLFDSDVELLTSTIGYVSSNNTRKEEVIDLSGIDIIRKRKVRIGVKAQDIISSIEPITNKIIKLIECNLNKFPNSIHTEIIESGIYLTGGGACIEGMDKLIASKTNIDVTVPSDPIHAVINGAIQTLNYWDGKKQWWKNLSWPRLSS